MKIDTSIESAVMAVYLAYWETYINGDVEKLASFLEDNYTQVGSAESEVFFNKADAVSFVRSTINQVAGKVSMRNSDIRLEDMGGLILINELADLYFEMDGTWAFYAKFRATSLMKQKNGEWKIIHQHSSMPDLRAQEGENIAIEKITRENLELRDAIKRRTIELEHQNRELEIETSLERVRTVAMGMRKGDELMDICEVLFAELEKLGFSGLRNAMINIYDDANESFLNYDFSPGPGKTVTPFTYNIHPIIQRQVKQLRSSKDAFSEIVISGSELAEFRSLRVSNGEADDPRFDDIIAINYYFYSTGVGAIGISSFNSITDENRNILKRFRNVFDLAYQRYMDISQAESQARESKIQLALERVRARAMAMQHSGELREIAAAVHEQILGLGFTSGFCSIVIMDRISGDMTWWMFFPGKEYPESYQMPYCEHPFYLAQLNNWKRGEKYSVIEVSGEEKKSYDKYTFSQTDFVKIPIENQRFMMAFEKIIFSNAYMKHGAFSWGVEQIDEEHAAVLQRFAGVFEQCYTRFLDLQKAEAQAREALIELSLERVRARTMAMQHSSELADAAMLLFQQMQPLDIPAWSTGYCTWEDDKQAANFWMSSEGLFQSPFKLPLTEEPVCIRYREAYLQGEEFYAAEYSGETLAFMYAYMMDFPAVSNMWNRFMDEGVAPVFPTFQINHVVYFSQGFLLFVTHQHIPEMHEVFKRFGKVFDQTYTRFLDLQKSEAQTRDAQIEAALERVRSRTMGMQKSEELKDVIKIIYQQLSHLKINCNHAGFVVDYTPGGDWHFWIADEQDIPAKITHPYFDSVWANQFNEANATGTNLFATYLNFEEKNKFYHELLSYVPGLPESTKDFYLSCPGLAASTVLFDTVGLYIENFSAIPYTDEENNILLRLGKVFQQTYTRFLDLKKAEAQAKEAQIEAALEKVRSRTMAMQKSDELLDVASILFQQVKALGVPQWNCGFNIWEIGDEEFIYYPGTPDGIISPFPCKIPLKEHPVFKSFDESRRRGDELFIYEKEGDLQKGHYQYMLSLPGVGDLLQSMLDAGFKFPAFQIDHVANFAYGNLIFITYQHFPEMHDVFKRFAKVFEQTYTRFLDLKKAEAQTREAQIEAALERVRAASMAMHKSEELAKVVTVLYNQLKALQIDFFQLFSSILYLEKGNQDVWMSPIEGILEEPFYYNAPTAPWENTTIKDWKEGKEFSYVSLQGKHAIQQFFHVMEEITGTGYFNKVIKNHVYNFENLESTEVNHKYGRFGLVQFVKATAEEKNILKRFAKVFEQAYTRFLDLQKAEEQAREALIEAALERVRTQAMAMHKSDDLLNISKVLYEELKILGIDEIRNAMILIHDEKNDFFLDYDYSSIGGKITRIPTNGISLIEKYVKELKVNEKSKVNFLELIVSGEELESWKKARKTTGQLDDPRLDSIETLYYYHYSIGTGNVSISTFSSLSNKKLQVLERFRNVFQLPYQRYHDIEIAVAQSEQARLDLIQIQTEKKRAEDALTILKATQTQLIQSEKLASLGELTAGIAHEIQNPLNFVNNFSEVNQELVDELQQELKAGRIDDAIEISNEIKENEQKINHHGKRADAIVKGMLQHSRNSAGEKIVTDINALADEYLRLAYHGFRSKDKDCNISLQTELDTSLPTIAVIPQDIGRVLLNLFNNAFYAVAQRKMQVGDNFEPIVWVSTRMNGDKLVITVKDNGNGIPVKVLDKIFQPFFTTKPTGQGTGLGLSLSYDIIKSHGGTLEVEAREGADTQFIISLAC